MRSGDRLRRWLISPKVEQPLHARRQIRTLSALLLVLLVGGGALTVAYMVELRDFLRETWLDHAVSVAALLAIFALYRLNYRGHFRAAASTVALLAVAVIAFSAVPQTSANELSMLYYLSIPVVLSGLVLSVWFTAVVAVTALGATALVGFLVPGASVQVPLTLTFFVGAIVVVAANFRRLVERDRVRELRESEARYQHLATHDALTGLPNRLLFEETVVRLLAGVRRRKVRLGILMLDLDNFKDINDALGHSNGDRFLAQLGARLGDLLRASDVVSRQGGDEFLIAVTDIDSPDDVERIVHKIKGEVRRPVFVEGHEVLVTAGVGVSIFPDHGDSVSELVRQADVALYRAKTRGGDMTGVFSNEMSVAAARRLELTGELRRAVHAGEIAVVYQPKVDSASGHAVGFECLARWAPANHGTIAPSVFIPLAEQLGLISDLTRHVLRAGAAIAADTGAFVSVNISDWDLRGDHLARSIEELIAEFSLEPGQLELELTENIVFRSLDRSLMGLRMLKDLGVRIAVDDFGAGYATLRQIAAFPLDTLKIDRSFIKHLDNGAGDTAIVAGIVEIASRLGMEVVAEGVETKAQLNTLAELGCTKVQGWLYSPAVSADEVRSVMAKEFRPIADRVVAHDL